MSNLNPVTKELMSNYFKFHAVCIQYLLKVDYILLFHSNLANSLKYLLLKY